MEVEGRTWTGTEFFVAQICNLLYRRIAFGIPLTFPTQPPMTAAGGLQIRDTAECNSALRSEAFCPTPDWHLTPNQAPPLLGTDANHERRNYSVDNDFSQTYFSPMEQHRLNLGKDRRNYPSVHHLFGRQDVRSILYIMLIFSLLEAAGCSRRPSEGSLQDALARSLPHDVSIPPPDASRKFKHKLTAEGSNWTVKVQWNAGDLDRFVTWREGADGFSLGIPLRVRPEPFTQSFWGLTVTTYGPYQPACVHHRAGADWHVQMSHEQADFPTEADLTKFLQRSIPGQPHAHPVLSPDGVLVTLRGPSYSGTTSLDVEIWVLTVNGQTPSASLLKPFLTGKLSIEPNMRTG